MVSWDILYDGHNVKRYKCIDRTNHYEYVIYIHKKCILGYELYKNSTLILCIGYPIKGQIPYTLATITNLLNNFKRDLLIAQL